MTTKIFVNLPVRDLKKSMAFYKALGFDHNPQFTDETAACIVISDDIYAMLLTHAKFSEFTSKSIVDARQSTEVLTALTVEHREDVDTLVKKGVAAGGSESRPAMDYGFMYAHAIDDLDGHTWEFIWMDPQAVAPEVMKSTEA